MLQGWEVAPAIGMTLEQPLLLPGKVEAGSGWVRLLHSWAQCWLSRRHDDASEQPGVGGHVYAGPSRDAGRGLGGF